MLHREHVGSSSRFMESPVLNALALPFARGQFHFPKGPNHAHRHRKILQYRPGYGFITNEAGGPDAFVHITAVERAGLGTLREGQKLSYELETGQNGKTSAVDLADAS